MESITAASVGLWGLLHTILFVRSTTVLSQIPGQGPAPGSASKSNAASLHKNARPFAKLMPRLRRSRIDLRRYSSASTAADCVFFHTISSAQVISAESSQTCVVSSLISSDRHRADFRGLSSTFVYLRRLERRFHRKEIVQFLQTLSFLGRLGWWSGESRAFALRDKISSRLTPQ